MCFLLISFSTFLFVPFSVLQQLDPEIAEDGVLKQSETDGKEVPLGKMVKHIKSYSAKGKKFKKDKSALAETGNAENDVDILKMVREINLDNLGQSSKFASSNGHEHSPSMKSRLDLKLQKGEKRKASGETSVSVPKRRRSMSSQRIPSSTSKAPLSDTGDDLLEVRVFSF